MTVLTPQGIQADLMRQGFMRRGKAAKFKVTAVRDQDGVLLHPDSCLCASKREASSVASRWTELRGVKFVVETL